MKLQNYLLLALLFFVVACSDDEDNNPSVAQYLASNGITDYQETESGLIYVIDQQGTGNLPVYGQVITVNYDGYTLGDKLFDSNQNGDFEIALGVSGVIEGWTEGLSYFKKGSSGTLYIPSDLAYGNQATGDIGANEDLKFDISIVDIK